MAFTISPLIRDLEPLIRQKIDTKTKPLGALGQLEAVALQIALIQQTDSPVLRHPHIVVFAADHGIAAEGVSPYPAEVTRQMMLNFVNGGAAINVFCRQQGIVLKVVDAGVKGGIFDENLPIIQRKIGNGTRNFMKDTAMSAFEREMCLKNGAQIVQQIHAKGCNVIGFGEMGIGNTSSAAVLMALICNVPIEQCVGRGTGLDDEGLKHKINVLQTAMAFHKPLPHTPYAILETFGGYEIAQMTGAFLEAARLKMTLLVDGFIATAAFLVAHSLAPNVKDYAIFCHQSDEQGHGLMLDYLGAKPLLHLGLRLGEGTGAAVAYPLIDSAVRFLNEMANFESAEVSQQTTTML